MVSLKKNPEPYVWLMFGINKKQNRKHKMIVNDKTATLLLLGMLAATSAAVGAEPDLSKLPPAASQQGVTYAKDIRPLLEASCFRCHSGDKPKAGLRLDSLEAALKGGKDGKVITPGKSDKSELVIAVARIDEEKAMPPKFKPGRGGPGGPGGGPGGPPPPPPGGSNPPRPPGGPGGFGPPPKPLTPEQVGLIRAWIDQGAK
jgi:hypothetical protein